MAFKFRLEKCLQLKVLDESRALEELGHCQNALNKCERLILDLERARGLITRGLCSGENQCIGALEFEMASRQLQALYDNIQTMREHQAGLHDELGVKQKKAQDSMSVRKSHEQIKERAHLRWRKQARRKARKQQDEVGGRSASLRSCLEVEDE